MKRLVPLLLACALPVLHAQAARHIAIAGRDVAVWLPEGQAPAGGFPVVVFSHGFSGCNTQSTFLMKALAGAGYLAVAPNHADARCGTARGGPARGFRSEAPFQKPEEWSDATYKNRAEDIRVVLDAVLRGGSFQGVAVNGGQAGIAGHSLGGYTALALGGAWASWRDKRIRAVLALSPFCTPLVAKGDLGHLGVPVMYQGGTIDLGITPTVKQPNGAYDRTSAPKYFVELAGAGHFAWTDLNPRFQETIDAYSVAFFDRWLKGQADAAARLASLLGDARPKLVAQVRADAK